MKKPKEESETERKGVTKKKARGKRLRLKENQKQKDREREKGELREKGNVLPGRAWSGSIGTMDCDEYRERAEKEACVESTKQKGPM